MDDLTHTKGIIYTDAKSGSLKVRRYVLTVVAGPDSGLEKTFETGTILIGTHENNDVVLTDPTISRYHLEIQARADGLRVTDQDSTNGTFLGKTRLGSVIVRGRTHLKVGGNTEIEIVPADQKIKLAAYKQNRFGRAFGESKSITDVFALLNQVSATDATILLEGETGTGKELLAEAIHLASPRHKKGYVIVDCGSIPRDLMASELFGHTKGSFTGATMNKRGLADEADGGTLFLDEIGELPLELQPHLLRLLERKEIRPIGETKSHRVDVRLVAATNRDLAKMVKEGSFREDLYYRLAVVKVKVPALRDRMDDIPGLVRYFLDEMGQTDFDVPESVIEQLQHHDWPGNIRELRNVVERGMSLATTTIRPEHLGPLGSSRESSPAKSEHDAHVMELPFKEAKGILVESFEREYLEQLLKRHDGNISRAAVEAGIDRNYIHRLVKKYDIELKR